jgi:predicted glycoside hydrolase/deacetylase ChbG (UPF0249 family)
MATPGRSLIVNADDFGRSRGVNAGVIKGHEEGIVTSASLMVRWPSASEAAAYARANPDLSLGLHVDLGEWTFSDGAWVPVYEVVRIDEWSALEQEVRTQLSSFRALVGRDPTHVDSHQHVHGTALATGVLSVLSRELGVPLRNSSPGVRYCGDFYGQTRRGMPLQDAISIGRLIQILKSLPPGTTELACHPGEGNDIESTYRDERELELKVLCDPRIREAIESEGIILRSFADVVCGDPD